MKTAPQTAGEKTPRARKKNRKRVLNPWLQLAVLTCAGMLGAWLLFQFMVKVIHPYKLGHDEAQEVAALREKLNLQQERNNELARRVAYLRSGEGAEREARRQGFHRLGEVVYLLDQSALSETNAVPPANVAP